VLAQLFTLALDGDSFRRLYVCHLIDAKLLSFEKGLYSMQQCLSVEQWLRLPESVVINDF
jgi:hypothetical protein